MATGGRAENMSDEYVEFPCYVCETKQKVKEATRYCFDCLKLFCDECLPVHNSLLDKHKVLPLNEESLQKILIQRCDIHPEEVIAYFCKDHETLLCKQCQAYYHG